LGAQAGDAVVAEVRRALLLDGRAVLGRAVAEDGDGHHRLWLKATLLHPVAATADLLPLLDLVTETAERVASGEGGGGDGDSEDGGGDTAAPAEERLSP
ncbi:aspartate aminotransferase family protein, partial [Streptomyces sp. ZEA17I]